MYLKSKAEISCFQKYSDPEFSAYREPFGSKYSFD